MLFSFQIMNSQDISKYQWKNRLVIISAENADAPLVKDQKRELEKDPKALKDRKLKVILATPGQQREILPEKLSVKTSSLYSTLNENGDFQVFLIGLDGNVKLEQRGILGLNTLFQTIDAMPMRQAEMNKNNH